MCVCVCSQRQEDLFRRFTRWLHAEAVPPPPVEFNTNSHVDAWDSRPMRIDTKLTTGTHRQPLFTLQKRMLEWLKFGFKDPYSDRQSSDGDSWITDVWFCPKRYLFLFWEKYLLAPSTTTDRIAPAAPPHNMIVKARQGCSHCHYLCGYKHIFVPVHLWWEEDVNKNATTALLRAIPAFGQCRTSSPPLPL